ncbi:CopL family metal-binding regulatory protein [Xanthomonas sontii]|uniref:CopL family metal-binding regulatory protein n=1 Tax=Xanthomonas sontii TaxID=2650745 RepID=A0A6N7QD35_9XANT|nr:CopL family metal-binding regulatory protein [Xanthomonas sp. SHU 166]MRH01720.1 CopL family metal-binding regulatory protein [Xanthomonas sontii]MRH76052.1 CopL family metal-binding regulatory protein [Xanthomonas sontii]
MPTFAVLLRLLLCLSLLLNGTAAAMAMPGMATDGTSKNDAAVASAAPVHAAMPCHDAPPPPPTEHDGHCHDHAGKHGNCGGMAGCQCPHAQPLPALLAMPLALPRLPRTLIAAAPQGAHGAPGLPRLERPPSA